MHPALWLIMVLPYVIALALVLLVQAARWLARTAMTIRPGQGPPEAPLTEPPRAVVFLVHGTFARRAAWTLPGSALRTAVEQGVRGPVAFRQVLWSGRNSISGRRAACAHLQDMLLASFRESPDVPHLVIAHSHGGNIAMQALSRSAKLAMRCHLICLSTPFLVLRRRAGNAAMHLFARIMPFIVTLLALRQVNLWVDPIGNLGANKDVALLIVLASLGLSAAVTIAVSRASQRIAQQIAEDYRPPHVTRANVLLLRTVADEASMGIAAANLINRVTHTVLNGASALFVQARRTVDAVRIRYRRWLYAILILSPIFFMGLFYASWHHLKPEGPIPVEVGAILLFGGIVVYIGALGFLIFPGHLLEWIAAIVLGVILAPVLLMLSILSMATGLEMALANAHVEFSAESTPVGTWKVVMIDDPPDPAGPGAQPVLRPLQHSLSYRNPAALNAVAVWIWRNVVPQSPGDKEDGKPRQHRATSRWS